MVVATSRQTNEIEDCSVENGSVANSRSLQATLVANDATGGQTTRSRAIY